MRLSISLFDWEIWCWPADDRCCIVFEPLLCSFASPFQYLCCFCPLVCPSHPSLSSWWALCSSKYNYSPLRIQCDKFQGEVTHGCYGYPLFCILSTHTCVLPALSSMGTYTPFEVCLVISLYAHTNI